METTINESFGTFGIFLMLYQIFFVAFLIAFIVFGIKFILKLFKLMDSQTQLNKEKLRKLQKEG